MDSSDGVKLYGWRPVPSFLKEFLLDLDSDDKDRVEEWVTRPHAPVIWDILGVMRGVTFIDKEG